MENIIHFFIQNKFKLFDYFKHIKINQKKTLVKFELLDERKLSITFYIYGEPQKKAVPFEDKVKRIFHTSENLSTLDQLIKEINSGYYFSFSSCKRISNENEPLIHAYQINIVFEKN